MGFLIYNVDDGLHNDIELIQCSDTSQVFDGYVKRCLSYLIDPAVIVGSRWGLFVANNELRDKDLGKRAGRLQMALTSSEPQ